MSDVPIFFQGAVQLAGWSENHQSGVKVTFWLESSDELEPFRGATIRKGRIAGQLFQMVLVEIDADDGGKPVRHPSNSAHLLLTGPDFLNYARALANPPGARDHWDSERARAWAKYVMNVKSLSELDSDPAALMRYEQLVRKPFALWNGTSEPDDELYE